MDHTQYSRLLYHCNTVMVILTFSCYEFQSEFIFLRLNQCQIVFPAYLIFTNTMVWLYRLPGVVTLL